MPATRKRRNRSTPSSAEIVAPGGGTQSDVDNLAQNLGLGADAVHAILNCQGAGITPARSSRSSNTGATGGVADGGAAAVAGSSAWADFMTEEGFGGAAPSSTPAAAATTAPVVPSVTNESKKAKRESGSRSASAAKKAEADAKSTSTLTSSSEPAVREYLLPIRPRMRLDDDHDADDEDESSNQYSYNTPGILAQTGTLDCTIVGRTKRLLEFPQDIQEPTILTFKSKFYNTLIAFIAASSSSCHSIAIDVHGKAYAWGRNESGQCGNGSSAPCLPLPTKISISGAGRFVGAAVGKMHSLLVDEYGAVFAAGSNKCGQCGVNSSVDTVSNFRKCVLVGDGKDGEDTIKVVQVSCGENFSVLLTDQGHIYSAGLSEFGQLGNGETGEHFVTASKIAFANASKFERRAIFVQSAADAEASGMKLTAEESSANNKTKMLPLLDSANIVIASISCGKNHTIAVEAPCTQSPTDHPPRVFTWGCGDYGCLGHVVQADEYKPRLIATLRGPLFASNPPVRASAGERCSMIQTKHGHVYYWGKIRTASEATMRPALIEALANNGHVVTSCGAGATSVFCTTSNGVTVSWGAASYGELGYGRKGAKSSAKPKFVEKLDKCLVTDIACGFGHTLFLIRDHDEEDKKAWAKLETVEEKDLNDFIAFISRTVKVVDVGVAGDTADSEIADVPTPKKGRGRPKKK